MHHRSFNFYIETSSSSKSVRFIPKNRSGIQVLSVTYISWVGRVRHMHSKR